MSIYVNSGMYVSDYSLTNNLMHIYSGGTADKTTLNSGGSILISSGGTASRTTVNSGGRIMVYSGAVAHTATIMTGGSEYVFRGGTANSVAVSGNGELVLHGGTVNSAAISSGGYMFVYSGGWVNNAVAHFFGAILIYNGGVAYETVVSNGRMDVSSGGMMLGGAVRGGKVSVFSGGMAMLAAVSNGGVMAVGRGGAANFVIVASGGSVFLSSGGVASGATISSGGELFVYPNGAAYSATVLNEGLMYVNGSGAVAHSTTVRNSGQVWVWGSGRASSSIISSGGLLRVFKSGSANFTTVSSGGSLSISSGGKVLNTTVLSGGHVFVSSGGTANSTTVNYWGYMRVSSGGTANSTTVNVGGMNVYGTANSTTVSGGGMYVYSGGVANSTTVTEGDGIWTGNLYVSDGGRAVSTYISSGYAFVFADGAVSSTVMDGGVLSLGGIASDTVAVKGGSITLEAGAKHTGRLSITADTVVVAKKNSVIDFDISALSPGNTAPINFLSYITGSPDYTITVSASQTAGSYKLADFAGSFDKTVTVVTDTGETFGSLAFGGTLNAGYCSYSLGKSGAALALTVAVGVVATVTGKFAGIGGVFQLSRHGNGVLHMVDAATILLGSLDPAKWELAAVGDFNGDGNDGLLWVEKATGYAYMQYDMTTFAEVNNKTNCLGVVGEGYSIKAGGDFSGSGIDGVLMQGPAFGDPEISLNYGLPVWARDNTGATYNGWLGALVNTWQPGDPLKGDLNDPVSINANNYMYEVVGVGDFNGDGRDDVMLQNTMPKTVNGKTITGSGDVFTFLTGDEAAIKAGAPPTVCYAGCATDGWEVIGFGDFDHDGVDDALLSDGTGIAGWKMTNGQRGADFWFGNLPSGYEISGTADVDDDGTDDIVLRSVADNQFSAWTVANGIVTGSHELKYAFALK
jgi:autotransporter passenger strand-loop-strand repeat protein